MSNLLTKKIHFREIKVKIFHEYYWLQLFMQLSTNIIMYNYLK